MLLPKTLAAVGALLVVGVGLPAQSPNPRFGRPKPELVPVALPSSIALSDVQVNLLRRGGACLGGAEDAIAYTCSNAHGV